MLHDMDDVLLARGRTFLVFILLGLSGYALGVFPTLFWRCVCVFMYSHVKTLCVFILSCPSSCDVCEHVPYWPCSFIIFSLMRRGGLLTFHSKKIDNKRKGQALGKVEEIF